MGSEAKPPADAAPSLDEFIPGHVPVVDPEGKLGSVPAAEYETAKASGYRIQNEAEANRFYDKLKFGNSPTKAALAGAARGVTLGLSDVALRSTGLVKGSTLTGLKEQNEGASTAGEVAGTVGSLLIPGEQEVSGPALAAKLGKAVTGGLARVGAGLGERIAVKAASGAAEGLLYGAGSAVSEAALGDAPLNAEKFIATTGLGGLLGGAGGGVGELIGAGVKAATAKAAGVDGLREWAEKTGDKFTLKALGGTKPALAKLSNEERAAIAEHLRSNGLISPLGDASTNFGAVKEAASQRAQGIGREMGVSEIETGALNETTPKNEAKVILRDGKRAAGGTMGDVLQRVDDAGAVMDPAPALEKIEAHYEGLNSLEQEIAKPEIDRIRRVFAEEGKKGRFGFTALNDLKSSLMDEVSYGPGTSTARNNALKSMVGILKDEIDDQLGNQIRTLSKTMPEMESAFGDFKNAKRLYGLLSEGEKIAKGRVTGKDIILGMAKKAGVEEGESATSFNLLSKAMDLGQSGVNREGGNNVVSLTDRLHGIGTAATVGGPLGAIAGVVAGAFNKAMRERGPSMLSHALGQIAEHPALDTIAKGFHGAVQKSLDTGLLGHYGPALANAAAQGPAETLMTHLHLAQTDPKYRETMALAGFPQEDDERHGALEQKALALHSMGQALEAHDKTMSNAVDRMVRGGPAPALSASTLARQDFGSKRQAKDDVNAHRTHADDITKLAADPAALADRVARNLQGVGEHAPATAAAMSATASRAVQFLSQKLARPPQGGPLAPKWHQSATEIASFGRYLHAVQDPMSVVKAAASGAIDPAGLEVLKNVYPSLMADLQKRVASKMAEQPKGVPYSRKVTLSLLSGIDADGTVNGQSIAHAQAVFRKAPEQQSQQHQPSPARADKLTVASRSELPTQAGVHRE